MYFLLYFTFELVSRGFDRSYVAVDPTADTQGFKFAVAQPISGACTVQQTSGTVPAMNNPCTGYETGSVAWNIQNWFLDTQEWILHCAESGNWETIGEAKKKTIWEDADLGNADKKWLRVDVDTANKNNNPVTPDSPSSWLKDTSAGLATVNDLCAASEMSGWRNGGALFICMHAMTNQQQFVAIICSRGVALDTPDCGTGGAVELDPNNLITTSSTDCPIDAAAFHI